MIKLNIQRFASTNQTTHYDLSQYVANDKPTYLVDYNQDMNKIDTAIYGAESTANQASNNIGTMSELDTTEKSSLVGAINEVKGEADTNSSNISTNTSNISTLGANQGTMANLTTTDKTSLVGAINEVNAVNQTQGSNIGDLTNLETITKSDLVNAINEIVEKFTFNYKSLSVTGTGCIVDSGFANLSSAYNNDGSIGKIYGSVKLSNLSSNAKIVTSDTGLRPSSDIVLNGLMIKQNVDFQCYVQSFTLKTDGTIECNVGSTGNWCRLLFMASMIYATDFGDAPIPNSN